MDCFELTAVLGCYTNGATKQTVAVHYTHDEKGQPAVRYLDNVGNVVVGATNANVTLGECKLDAPSYNITGGGAHIAGPARALTPAFAGAASAWGTGSVPNSLHSITVSARGVLDGVPGGTADQILVTMPDSTVLAMMNGETRTFSVERDSDTALVREYEIAASGMAYANITYTFF